MSARLSLQKSLSFLLFLFVFVILIDPADKIFGAKKLFFVSSLVLSFSLFMLEKSYSMPRRSLFFSFFFFLFFISFYGFYKGMINNHLPYRLDYAVGYLFSLSPLLLLFFVSFSKIDFEQLFINAIKIFTILYAIFSIVFFFVFEPSSSFVNLLNYKVEAAKVGYREYGALVLPMVYWKSSVLLVFLIGYCMNKSGVSSKMFFLISVYLLFISGTRANMLVSILFFLLWIGSYFKLKLGKPALIFIFSFLLLGCFGFFAVFHEFLFDNFLSVSEPSNKLKLGHFFSYLDFFSTDIFSFLFGAGYGTGMYSASTDSYLFSLELTYLELIRFYGLFLFLIFDFFLLYPVYFFYRRNSYYFYSWLAYLMVAGSNPLVLSSTGAFAIMFVYFLIFSRGYNRCTGVCAVKRSFS